MAIKIKTKKPKHRKRLGRIGVLMGGPSSERKISLKSGQAVFEALKNSGLDVIAIDIKTEDLGENIRVVKSAGIDCAFLALHGKFGEDGQAQGILEVLNIPYTGSGVSASRLAMDKVASRRIFQVYGLHVPKYIVLDKYMRDSNWRWEGRFVFPLVVKPASHGSSIGLSIVDNAKDLEGALDLAFVFDHQVLVEEYIAGREITVGILENYALPVVEILTKKRFFDYEAKYQAGLTDYIVPAQIEEKLVQEAQNAALAAHKVLGCWGCSRVDIILKNDSIPFVLEVNTIPGFTATSLLPKAAKVSGLDFSALCLKLIQLAYEKA